MRERKLKILHPFRSIWRQWLKLARPFIIKNRVLLKSLINRQRSKRVVNVSQEFPTFWPSSDGDFRILNELTIRGINSIFPLLVEFGSSMSGHIARQVTEISSFPGVNEQSHESQKLKELLDFYGSDKANTHDYFLIYAALLKDRLAVSSLLEIGLGTNNPDVVSNMGVGGKPGASIRAFRDFLPNASIFGADIDRRILFQEERLATFYVDQTSEASFEVLSQDIPPCIDLIIDDGLHAPDANIRTLIFALERIRVGGAIVIEDINVNHLNIWFVIRFLLNPTTFESWIVRCRSAYLFIVKKKS